MLSVHWPSDSSPFGPVGLREAVNWSSKVGGVLVTKERRGGEQCSRILPKKQLFTPSLITSETCSNPALTYFLDTGQTSSTTCPLTLHSKGPSQSSITLGDVTAVLDIVAGYNSAGRTGHGATNAGR